MSLSRKITTFLFIVLPVMDGVAAVHALRTINSNVIIIGASGSTKRTKQLEAA
jgi:CheY-like chemotaxis protein